MYTIVAKRWFQKSFGNTYHSCEVFHNSKSIGQVPYTYGYGEQYRQTAHQIMVDAGHYDGDLSSFLVEEIRDYDKYLWLVSDVSRKKDL